MRRHPHQNRIPTLTPEHNLVQILGFRRTHLRQHFFGFCPCGSKQRPFMSPHIPNDQNADGCSKKFPVVPKSDPPYVPPSPSLSPPHSRCIQIVLYTSLNTILLLSWRMEGIQCRMVGSGCLHNDGTDGLLSRRLLFAKLGGNGGGLDFVLVLV